MSHNQYKNLPDDDRPIPDHMKSNDPFANFGKPEPQGIIPPSELTTAGRRVVGRPSIGNVPGHQVEPLGEPLNVPAWARQWHPTKYTVIYPGQVIDVPVSETPVDERLVQAQEAIRTLNQRVEKAEFLAQSWQGTAERALNEWGRVLQAKDAYRKVWSAREYLRLRNQCSVDHGGEYHVGDYAAVRIFSNVLEELDSVTLKIAGEIRQKYRSV